MYRNQCVAKPVSAHHKRRYQSVLQMVTSLLWDFVDYLEARSSGYVGGGYGGEDKKVQEGAACSGCKWGRMYWYIDASPSRTPNQIARFAVSDMR